jgi:[ribosomal protein S5]-alanine N-acetyltransferase
MALTYPDPDLTDAVVRLRRWRETDIDCIRQAAMDPRIPEGTTVPALYTPDAGRALIRRQRQRVENGEGVSLAIVAAGSDEALGLLWLGIRPQAGVLGLGYWVVPGARRRGLANRATLLAVDWVLREAGIARVEAWVEPNNIVAIPAGRSGLRARRGAALLPGLSNSPRRRRGLLTDCPGRLASPERLSGGSGLR